MAPFDAGFAHFNESLPAGMMSTGLAAANTASATIVVTTITTTAGAMTPVVDYNPEMVERLLRQKNGPFTKAPGEAAFLKWLADA